jgi:hypothetical protein
MGWFVNLAAAGWLLTGGTGNNGQPSDGVT